MLCTDRCHRDAHRKLVCRGNFDRARSRVCRNAPGGFELGRELSQFCYVGEREWSDGDWGIVLVDTDGMALMRLDVGWVPIIRAYCS